MDPSILTQGGDLRVVLPTLIGMFLLTLFSTAYKAVFIGLGKLIWKHLTTTVQISTSTWAFYMLMKIFEDEQVSRKLRVVKLISGQFNNEDTLTKGVGPGLHLIKFRGRHLLVNFEVNDEMSAMYIENERITCTMTWWGKKPLVVDELLASIMDQRGKGDTGRVAMSVYNGEHWRPNGSFALRSMDSIFIEQEKIERILGSLQWFYDHREWYEQKGIPYRFGLMLSGKPGTGKTSLIKAVASHFARSLFILPVDQIDHMEDAFMEAYDKAIIVVEDIDTAKVVGRRDGEEAASEEVQLATGGWHGGLTLRRSSLSSVLNTIDGIASHDGRVLIFTTNHLDVLDPALLRPGRIDLSVEIGNITGPTFKKFYERFYDKYDPAWFLNAWEFNKTLAVNGSELQNEFLTNKLDSTEILEKYCVRR